MTFLLDRRTAWRLSLFAWALLVAGGLTLGPGLALAGKGPSKADAKIAKRSAKLYIKQNLYDKALEQLLIAVEGNPKDLESQYLLGFLYSERGLIEPMNVQFDKVLKMKKGKKKYGDEIEQAREMWWSRNYNVGVQSINMQNFADAIEAFQAAMLVIPDRADTYKGLGIAYLQTGQTQAGIDAYRKAIELDSTDATAYVNLSIAYMNAGEPEKAVKQLSVGHRVHPENLGILEKLGLAYQMAGDNEGALEAAEKALKIDPNKLEVLNMAGRIYLMGGNYERATELLEKVVEQMPNDMNVVFNLAAAYKSAKQFDKAEALFLKTTEALPDDDEAWYQLGLIYDRTDQYLKAIESFEKVVELSPSNAQGWLALSRVCARYSGALDEAGGDAGGGEEAAKWAKRAEEAFNMADALQSQ
jgi:tetratricopeptide (TPR) repeat protein